MRGVPPRRFAGELALLSTVWAGLAVTGCSAFAPSASRLPSTVACGGSTARGLGLCRLAVRQAVPRQRRCHSDGIAMTSSTEQAAALAVLKTRIIQLTSEFGDPAVGVPVHVQRHINDIAREMESLNPMPDAASAQKQALQGTWRVRYTNCVPPSNGQLGPWIGEPFQVVDIDSASYQNRLGFFGRNVELVLSARWRERDSESWFVTFETIGLELFGQALPTIRFPAGTQKTWCMTYTDADTRLVRAGSEGARSPARQLGMYAPDLGVEKDAFLFVMTRVKD